MRYIYLDESGDMGFDFSKSGTSKHLLITFLMLNEPRPIVSLVKKVFTSLLTTTKRKNNDMLHAYYEKDVTVKRLLNGLASKDVKIATMRLDKRKVLFIGNTHELYSSMVVALINRLYSDGFIDSNKDIKFIASRKNTSKKLNNDFSESVVNHAGNVKFDIEIVKSSDDKCLQAVDFVSWAYWQKYEKKNDSFATLIKEKTVREYVMYE